MSTNFSKYGPRPVRKTVSLYKLFEILATCQEKLNDPIPGQRVRYIYLYMTTAGPLNALTSIVENQLMIE